jgi:cytochrome c peroxidase
MPKKLSKQGALQVTRDLDRFANLYETEYATLGVSEKVGNDFALRCDLLSREAEKTAGIERTEDGQFKDPEIAKMASAIEKQAEMDPKNNYTEDQVQGWEFNPAEIGEEQSKALLRNEDEPYMDVFKQDEFDQLRQVQQDGMFSNAKSASLLIQKMAKILAENKIALPQVVKAVG